ncbi:MAG TPA: sugar phosphate isomerase/epimerase [Actinomycetota bacterium]|nr:sugar phosphate isomerase/epimerase [Actinomycetota bacterium]
MCTGHDDTASREEVARLSRRGFLRTAVTTAAVVGTSSALAAPALAQEASGHGRRRRRVPPDQISIQLYTLRDQLAIDLEGTLQALGDIGYTRVEHAGFVGRTVDEFKAALDAAGLRATSGHVQIPQPFDPTAWRASLADANVLGSRYIVHPFFGIDFATGEVVRTTAPWRAFARDLNRAGRMARDAGLKLGYHNHNWEFFRLTDNPTRTAYDVLTDTTDPDLVHLQLDLFWAVRGARDPVDLIRQNEGRVLQYHGKDLNQAGSFTDPGQGLLDFARIFRHSDEAGVREYIVERDDAGTPPRQPADALDTARVGYQFLRTVRF